MLLPVSHEDAVVRRLPVVSIFLIGACFAIQVYQSWVEPRLEKQFVETTLEMGRIKQALISRHIEREMETRRKAPGAQKQEPEDSAPSHWQVPRAARQPPQWIEEMRDHEALSTRFDAGELTQAGDPEYERFLELKDELEAIKMRFPANVLAYKPGASSVGLLTYMFSHAGWLHLIGNMWFLYLVACNLEDRWGRLQFSSFYVLGGVVAALAYAALHPGAEGLVGASGAVAAAMGAFAVCFARTEITIFYLYFIAIMPHWGTFKARTWLVLLFWAAEQFLMSYFEMSGGGGGVAYSAHAGGFVFGVVTAGLLRWTGLDAELDEASERAAVESDGWAEDPLYVSAMDMRDRHDREGALAELTRLIEEVPDHLSARQMLFALALQLGREDALDLSLPWLLQHHEALKEDDELVRLYTEMRHDFGTYGLTERELLRVATSAQRAKAPRVVMATVGEMIEQYPRGGLLPRGMWIASEVLAEFGAVEQQRDTLHRIVRRFPQHACGQLASTQLQQMTVTPASPP